MHNKKRLLKSSRLRLLLHESYLTTVLMLIQKVSADAYSHRLEAVLLLLHNGEWKSVAFTSRSLSDTERRYAQIEREALALTWACEKYSEYVLGKEIELETDHISLVLLLGKKT